MIGKPVIKHILLKNPQERWFYCIKNGSVKHVILKERNEKFQEPGRTEYGRADTEKMIWYKVCTD